MLSAGIKGLRQGRGAVALGWLALAMMTPGRAAADPNSDQLIVFVQRNNSPIDQGFRQNTLPRLKRLTEQQQVRLRVVDSLQEGAPESVTITPLLVYQNHRGRSIYQGRSNDLGRLGHFIRTSRHIPQGETPHFREQIHIWSLGRTRIWAPLKITRPKGKLPAGLDQQSFITLAREAIDRGLTRFKLGSRIALRRSDRGFYFDLHPWFGADGMLALTVVVFSQFHCKAPVFTSEHSAIVGPWSQRQKLFARAAALMERAVEQAIGDPIPGDGFDPVEEGIPVVDFDALGLPLPPAPKTASSVSVGRRTVPRHWTIVQNGADDPPMVHFRFPAPLDRYSGTIGRARGEVRLPADRRPAGATGFIEIDTADVTMGNEDLDQAISGRGFLFGKQFPRATFTVTKVHGSPEPIAFGRQATGRLEGVLSLKGKKRPLRLLMDVEPVIDNQGAPRLILRGAFEIDLTAFDIEGADGPAPARHTLLFDLYLMMKPVEASTGAAP